MLNSLPEWPILNLCQTKETGVKKREIAGLGQHGIFASDREKFTVFHNKKGGGGERKIKTKYSHLGNEDTKQRGNLDFAHCVL